MSRAQHSNVKGIELCLSWQPVSGGSVPDGAIEAGSNCYVARAKHSGDWVPGKAARGHVSAYVAYDGKEIACDHYEVLVASNLGHFGCGFEWKSASGGAVPKRALVAGWDNGAPLYVARATIEGEVCTGKAQPSHGCAYFPWNGVEHRVEDYEVLVLN